MTEPKRYAVFCYDQYYPGGGWGDMELHTASLEEAQTFFASRRDDFVELIDLFTGETLADR